MYIQNSKKKNLEYIISKIQTKLVEYAQKNQMNMNILEKITKEGCI